MPACDYCGLYLSTVSSLRRHVESQHSPNPRRYPCTICGRSFTRKDGLERHEYVHRSGPAFESLPLGNHERYEEGRHIDPGTRVTTPHLDTTGITTPNFSVDLSRTPSGSFTDTPNDIFGILDRPLVLDAHTATSQSTQGSSSRSDLRLIQDYLETIEVFVAFPTGRADAELRRPIASVIQWCAQPLHAAITHESMPLLRSIFKLIHREGLILDTVERFYFSFYGSPPVLTAVREGKNDVVHFLLDHGASYDATDGEGATAVLVAAEDGHLEVIRRLLDEGANIDVDSWAQYPGMTPLCLASRGGFHQVIELLLSHGANPSGTGTNDNPTPLELACGIGDFEAVKILLQGGADVNLGVIPPLQLGLEKGRAAMVQLLIQSRPCLMRLYGDCKTLLSTSTAESAMSPSISDHTAKTRLLQSYALQTVSADYNVDGSMKIGSGEINPVCFCNLCK